MKNALLVLTFGAVCGCTSLTPQDDPVNLRLQDLDARLGRIEKVVNNQSLVQLANQLDQLQAETKELRGEIETLQHDNETGQDRQRQLYLDVDRRLQALERGQGAVAGQGGGAGAFAGGAAGGGQFANQAGGGAGAASQSGASGAGGAAFGSGATGATGATGAATGGPAGAQAGGNDQQAYEAAFNLIQSRHYPEAAKAFENFLANYPQSTLSDNAQYWLAETHYVQRDFSGALPLFQKVVDMYGQSSKVPDALLKVGYCDYELKMRDQARAALEKVVHDYPDTTAARLAQQRLDRMTQEGG